MKLTSILFEGKASSSSAEGSRTLTIMSAWLNSSAAEPTTVTPAAS